MKILMLTPYLPFPPSSGGQVRSYNLIKHLSKTNEITLFSLIKEENEKNYIGELNKYCKKVLVFKRSKSPWTLRNILLTGFGVYPFLVIRNLSPKEKEAVRRELTENNYDLIHAETFYVMPHLPRTTIPILLVDQTIEYLVYKHYVDTIKNPFLRLLLNIDVAKLKHWERVYWRKADNVVAVSEYDKKKMLELEPELKVAIVPNGVDINFFTMKSNWTDRDPKILFVANFKWLQNVEAAEILLKKVFPMIKTKLANAKVWIVGQHIPESISIKKSDDILINNLEENDEQGIKDAYYNASVFVSPLSGPGGTRLKHLGAMAAKLPLITTSVGAEGLNAQDNIHLIVRNKPKDMAIESVKLIRKPDFARLLAENARKLVSLNFTWQKMTNKLEAVYEKTYREKKQ